MTTPERPLDRLTADPGWDDERLEAAFAARASRVTVPGDLVVATVERLRPAARRSPWAHLLPAGAVLVLVLGVIGGGVALLGGSGGLLGGGSVSFRDGPTPDLRTLDGGEYALDFPASWLAYGATAVAGSGGSIDAVLTTQPIEERCGGPMGVDINCVYEQRLEPGQLRIFIGRSSYRGQTVLDRADIENGTSTRLVVGGMPAVLDEFDDAPDDYYLADQSATWAIATPTSLARVIRIEFRAREPDAGAARGAVDALVASFRFTPPPTPLPDDPEAAVAAARGVLDAEAASFRQGFVPADDTDGQTYLDCLPESPGEDRVVGIDYGPGGDLGWTVLTRCRWSVTEDKNGPFWQIATVYEWTVGDDFGQFRESYWIDPAGTVLAMTSDGDVPPAGDPSATPTVTATPTSIGPDGTAVITLGTPGDLAQRDVRIADRTGALVSARPASPWEQGYSTGDIPDGAVRLIDLPDGGVLVRWDGSLCDDAFVLEVDAIDGGAVPDRVTLYGERGGSCRSMAVSWGIRLDFSVDVDATTMLGRNFVGATTVAPPSIPPSLPFPGPMEVLGLDVIDVEAALAIRARPDDDREIAVSGWFWENPSVARCRIGPGSMFGADCGFWDALEQGPGGGSRMPLYFGPAVTNVGLPKPSSAAIVVIGHFDDRRSDACGPARADACADVFWVDTLWMNGQSIDRDWTASTSDEPAPSGGHETAWARVTSPDGEPLTPLSVGLISGALLGTLEPASVGRIAAEPWIWLVTAYEPSSGRVRTFVIPDSVLQASDGIVFYEVDGDEVLTTTLIVD